MTFAIALNCWLYSLLHNTDQFFTFLGADEIITFSNDSFETNFYEKSIEQSSFMNELLSRTDRYDVVFFTTHLNYNTDFIKKFLTKTGVVIQATEKDLPSDDYGAFMRMLFSVRITFDIELNFSLMFLFLGLRNFQKAWIENLQYRALVG